MTGIDSMGKGLQIHCCGYFGISVGALKIGIVVHHVHACMGHKIVQEFHQIF